MRRWLVAGALIVSLSVSGCALLDSIFTPRPNGNKSPAQKVVEPYAGLLGPYGEAIMAALLLAQNLYLGGRKIQKRIKGK